MKIKISKKALTTMTFYAIIIKLSGESEGNRGKSERK